MSEANDTIVIKKVAGAGGKMRTVAICPGIRHWHGNYAQAAKCVAREAKYAAERAAKKG